MLQKNTQKKRDIRLFLENNTRMIVQKTEKMLKNRGYIFSQFDTFCMKKHKISRYFCCVDSGRFGGYTVYSKSKKHREEKEKFKSILFIFCTKIWAKVRISGQ